MINFVHQQNNSQHNDIQHNDIRHNDSELNGFKCDTLHQVSVCLVLHLHCYTDCRYAECYIFIALLSIVMLSVSFLLLY
jgi:hypothetical protein